MVLLPLLPCSRLCERAQLLLSGQNQAEASRLLRASVALYMFSRLATHLWESWLWQHPQAPRLELQVQR